MSYKNVIFRCKVKPNADDMYGIRTKLLAKGHHIIQYSVWGREAAPKSYIATFSVCSSSNFVFTSSNLNILHFILCRGRCCSACLMVLQLLGGTMAWGCQLWFLEVLRDAGWRVQEVLLDWRKSHALEPCRARWICGLPPSPPTDISYISYILLYIYIYIYIYACIWINICIHIFICI